MNQIFLLILPRQQQSHNFKRQDQLLQSTNQDPPRIVIKTEDDENGSLPKDNRLKNWADVFGDFLSEGLLRRKQTQLKRNTETAIDRAYLHEVPLKMNKKNFTKFIVGEISAEEFVNRKNQNLKLDKEIPKTVKKTKRPKINVTYRRSAVTDEGNYEIGFLKLLDERNEEMIKNNKHIKDSMLSRNQQKKKSKKEKQKIQ